MRYNSIKYNDTGNGDGVRVSLWLQGCDIKCAGCQNSDIWNFDDGNEYTNETTKDIISHINANGIPRDFSVLGGEPLHKRNLDTTINAVINVKKHCPNTKIWIWTGYNYEDLTSDKELFLLQHIDVLVDGKFILSQKNLQLKYKGSENQRVIDIQETLKLNKIIIYK